MIKMTQTSVLKEEIRALDLEKLDRDVISRILGTIVYNRAFFFYEEVGKPTGEYAVSLLDFCNKLNSVPSKSLTFHLQRGDFENWIRDVIGDIELSNRINNLRTNKVVRRSARSLRNKLHATVRDRVEQLQDLWHQALTWPTASVA